MSTPQPDPPRRKRHLFARSLGDVVKNATKPMMDKQGKLYGALLGNWPAIVGPERAAITRPQKLVFPRADAVGATLHLAVHPAHAAELPYMLDAMVEQCARYFGYRAIARIICHSAPELARAATPEPPAPVTDTPQDMRELLQRLRQRIMSEPPKN